MKTRNIFFIYAILLLVMIMPVKAGKAVGYVTINIENKPPRIENIRLLPGEAFADSVLECTADVVDEFPSIVKLQYEWYVNGKIINNKEGKLEGFNSGDQIECRITPNDIAQNGTSLSIFIEIKQAGLTTRFIKNSINLLGSETTLAEVNSYQKKGFASITGFAVASMNQNKGTVSLFGIIVILIIVNVNLIVRRRLRNDNRRKTKHPKQDYSFS